MNQLILPYQKNIKHTFENFYTDSHKNVQIIDSIKNIYRKKNSHIYICGEKSSGKSHLLHSACNYFGEKNKNCVYFPLNNFKNFKNDILNGFEEYDLVCIDDIDCIYGDKEWEYSLFILLNRILDSSKKIIFTSTTSLVLDKIKLKDLKSRISWGLIFMINKPSDSTKEKILQNIILEKEYNISLDVINHLLKKKNRDITSLINLVHKTGNYSLSVNKKIGIKNLNAIIK
tara:strand:+ start:723 stop:1412 length:690 start_codon:yes stop_codon:yes gene_type:complete